MIGIDTNVLLRLLLNDDKMQTPRAARLIYAAGPDEEILINPIVLVEAAWMLLRRGRSREEVAHALGDLCERSGITVQFPAAVRRALATFRSTRADLPDCLIAETNAEFGAPTTFTFDHDAARTPHFTLIPA
jgi:predicted nucleic-acid-binding protein